MMTLSTALSAGQAQKYYEAEYTNSRESYYSENESIDGEWFGKLRKQFGLEGAVDKESFARLTEGQDPRTGEQLIRRVSTKEYENRYGEKVKNSEHRAGYDATFSAPKSVSLAALVGDDHRIREAHKIAVKASLNEIENYVQARMGGNTPAQTTRRVAAALFEHDSARPDAETDYAAPQLHTHTVIFNLTTLADGKVKPIQPLELYRSQKYATAIYRTVLSEELQKLGYEVEVDPRTGAPEIKGFSQEYLVASSPRRKQVEKKAGEIKERLAQQGIDVKDGAGLNQAAAKLDRKSKRYDREEMRARHRQLDDRFGNEATRAVGTACERGSVLPGDEEVRKRAQSAVTFARQNAEAREAVVDRRRVVVDALRRNMAFTTYEAVTTELNERVESGEFITIQRFDKFEELTTSHTVALERSNVHQMLAGRNTLEPMMKRKEAIQLIKEIFVQQGLESSSDQYKAVGKIMVTRDRVFALEGLAGTGKTTALAILREASERQGFIVRGMAPTGRAADKLAESGIRTTTLQGFLKEPEFGSDLPISRRLYILDESSLADTKNLHLFLKKTGPQSRILLVGDTAQHQAVEAGAPFEQLVKAGIGCARLDKILRQRTSLKKPVELLSKREVLAAVTLLESQGRITEIKDDFERLKAIALDYVNNPKSTLIISPANSERIAINSLVHYELQNRGVVDHQNHQVAVLVNRQDMTGPERTFALAYVPGEDIIRYNTTSKVFAVKPGDYARVLANDHKDNTITVRFESGRQITYNPARLSGVSVYREAERDFAEGDRIQFRAPFTAGKVKNSELGTIKQITDDGMIVQLDKKRDVTIDLNKFRHLDLGYAVTSHSAQGQTVDRVLVNAETTETDLLVNQRMAYVAISRARLEARVYTDSMKEIGPAFNREKNKEIALHALTENKCGPDLETRSLSVESQPQLTLSSVETDSATRNLSFAERMQELNRRIILGEKVVAELNEKYVSARLEQVLNTRNVRRYSTLDQTTGLRRRISIHDVEKRAMSVASRVAEEQVSALDGGSRANMYRFREFREAEYDHQIEKHESTIKEILNSHASEIHNLTNRLNGAHHTNPRACAIAQNVENILSGNLPIPVIPLERLNELQLDAIRFKDAEAFERLEQIRQHLPHELGGPERDTFSLSRLRGQSILADSNVRVAEKRVDDFEKTRHFARFEIAGEEWSLVGVDRQQRLAKREIEFHQSAISAYRWRLYSGLQNPWKLRNLGEYRERAALAKESITNAREQIDRLQPIRAEVICRIDEHRAELKEHVYSERRMAQALNNVLDEVAQRVGQEATLPTPQFSSEELKRLDANSIALHDTDMLRLVEREMESHYGGTQQGRERVVTRAIGRLQASELNLQDLTQRLDSFATQREFLPVIYKGPEGQDRTASLRDLQPRSFSEKVSGVLSNADRYELNSLNEVLHDYHQQLIRDFESIKQFTASAREIIETNQHSSSFNRGHEVGANEKMHGEFNDYEIVRMETFATRQLDQHIRDHVAGVIQMSLMSQEQRDRLGTFSIETENSWTALQGPSSVDHVGELSESRNIHPQHPLNDNLNERLAELEENSQIWAILT